MHGQRSIAQLQQTGGNRHHNRFRHLLHHNSGVYKPEYDNITCLLQSIRSHLHKVTLKITDKNNLNHYWNSNDATSCKTACVRFLCQSYISWYRIVYVCRLYYIHDEHTKWLFRIIIWRISLKSQQLYGILKQRSNPMTAKRAVSGDQNRSSTTYQHYCIYQSYCGNSCCWVNTKPIV
jgi:hypothetical protein